MAGIYAESALRSINENRRNGEDCDFAIKVKGKSYKVHRLMLRACSQYFKAMFASEMVEARQGFVAVNDVGEEAVEQCIDFIYSGKAIPNMANVEDMIELASMWQLDELNEKCAAFLNNAIDFETCFRIKHITALHHFEDVDRKCDTFILKNMERLVDEGDFRDLSKEHLVGYLEEAQAESCAARTETLYQFLNAWYEAWACAMKAGNTFCAILQLVTISLCEVSVIEKRVWINSHVATCDNCKAYVANEVLGNCATSAPIPGGYQVDQTNCFFLKALSKAYKHLRVEECVDIYITDNFETLSEMPKFLEIPKDDFLSYLRSSAVGKVELQTLAKIIVKWILHDEKVRKKHFEGFDACFQLFCDEVRGEPERTRSSVMSSSSPPEIWFCVKAFATEFNCPILGSRADKLILENFHDICKRPEFKNLDKNDLVRYVSSDKLKGIRTSDIWEAVVDWVKHDVAIREDDFPDIFQSIDFTNAPTDFLKRTVCSEPLVKNATACKDTLMGHLFGRVGEMEKEVADMKKEWADMKKEMFPVKDRINALEKWRNVYYATESVNTKKEMYMKCRRRSEQSSTAAVGNL